MKIRVGDRVALSAGFLRNLSDYTYESASRRGEVLAVDRFGIADVLWEGEGPTPKRVNVNALVPADRLHLERA